HICQRFECKLGYERRILERELVCCGSHTKGISQHRGKLRARDRFVRSECTVWKSMDQIMVRCTHNSIFCPMFCNVVEFYFSLYGKHCKFRKMIHLCGNRVSFDR